MSQNGCIWREVVESGNLVQGLGRKPIRHFRNAKHVYVQTSSVFLICQGRKRVDILLSRCTVVLWGFVVFLLTNQYFYSNISPLLQNYWTETLWVKRKSLQNKKNAIFSHRFWTVECSSWECSSQILLPTDSRTCFEMWKPLDILPHCAWRGPAHGRVWSSKHPAAKSNLMFPQIFQCNRLGRKSISKQ